MLLSRNIKLGAAICEVKNVGVQCRGDTGDAVYKRCKKFREFMTYKMLYEETLNLTLQYVK